MKCAIRQVGLLPLALLSTLVATAGCAPDVELDERAGGLYRGDAQADLGGWHQTADEGGAHDAGIAAEELGLSPQVVQDKIAFQAAFHEFALSVLDRHPEQVAGVWIDTIPQIGGHIAFVGEVPEDVAVVGKWLDLLDPADIELTGGEAFPLVDGTRHAEVAHEALKAEGLTNFLTFYDTVTGALVVEVQVAPGKRHRSALSVERIARDAVMSTLHPRTSPFLVNDPEIVGRALDVQVDIRVADGDILDLEHARGGNLVTGSSSCTSGWAVNGASGDGITTAGHCVGINQLIEEGGTVNTTTWISQINGIDGDVEYHTTNHIELAEFYAEQGVIRDVNDLWNGLEIFGIQIGVGDTVCQYGRFSNNRSCNKTVEALGVQVTFTDGITRGNLARTDNPTSIGGDSGGGWSYNFTAFGGHVGSSSTKAYFLPVYYIQNELGLTVLTQ